MKKRFAKTKIIAVFLILLIVGISFAVFVGNRDKVYASNTPIYPEVNKKLSFEKAFALKNLPSEITSRMKFEIKNNSIVVSGYFPKSYTIEQKKKASMLFDEKYAKTTSHSVSYPLRWKKTYHIGGTKTTPVGKMSFYDEPGDIISYIDTDATLYDYFLPVPPQSLSKSRNKRFLVRFVFDKQCSSGIYRPWFASAAACMGVGHYFGLSSLRKCKRTHRFIQRRYICTEYLCSKRLGK